MRELLAMTPETGALTQAILHSRDQRLLEKLEAELNGSLEPPRTVAIVYGAAHMRAVVREITENRNFNVVASEWRTILNLD